MNKTKLEIITINEDVITTSGVCQHHDRAHFYSEYKEGTSMFGDSYMPNAYVILTQDYEMVRIGVEIESNAQVGKYYYLGDNLSYLECTGDHSAYVRDNSRYQPQP